ncbi:TfoX/Sxy family protein [Sphingomonas sp. MS122]|uniref:TfoX/Sxy family protein n=1 Tax=Sphingomonas sp. MS122 TaxID=3412683 RepID=UPI003C3064DD
MAFDAGLLDWVVEALEPVGTVTHRKMMGGATLYLDGTVFAIISSDDVLWFKADALSDAIWDDAGCERFTFEMKNRLASMNYRRAPDDVFDDADAMRQWAALGLEAGRRAPARKPKVSRRAR